MKLSKGFKVNGSENIKESYAIEGNNIYVNVDAGRYDKVMKELCLLLPTPVFFILEVPCSETEEQELRKSSYDPFHKNIYYIDGLDHRSTKLIFDKMSDILVNDGISQFGFSSHEDQKEVMKEKYNVIRIYADDKTEFVKKLNQLKIPEVEHILCASDLVNANNPGYCEKITVGDNKDIFDLVEFLKQIDMYKDHVEEINN